MALLQCVQVGGWCAILWQGAKSVYQSYSLREEAEEHPAGFAADAPVPLPRWQDGEYVMRWVVGVFDDGDGSADTSLPVYVQQEREWSTNNPAGGLHNPVQLVPFVRLAAPEPGSDAVG